MRRAALLALIAALAITGFADAQQPAPCAGRCWVPHATKKPWQIQLSGRISTKVTAPIMEVDCDEATAADLTRLKRHGGHVLGYVDAGSWESYRADADRFPPEVIGAAYDGYPDERWLDVRQTDVLLPILRDRMRTCLAKGFDGVDPDNVNGWENDTGFPLTAADQVAFDRAVADAAHALGLAVVLKNTGALVGDLGPWFDGAVVESCFRYRECAPYAAFVRRGRPVLAIEYRKTPARFCAQARRLGFSLIAKPLSLTASRHTCPA